METEMYLYDETELNRRARTEFRLPTNLMVDLSALRREAAIARGDAFLAGLRAVGRAIATLAAPALRWRRYRAAMAELNSLDERTLADIGIVRADIPRIAAGLWMRDRATLPAFPVAVAAANANVRKIAA
jgi:uncharacterized protein YjiS (DUF1127 family)